jgi:ATP-binding cassette subfamily B protein
MLLFGGLMLICSLIGLICNIVANRRASKTASEITEVLRHDLYVKTLSLSCKKTEEYTVPTLISRLTSDTYHFHNMLLMTQRIGVRAPILVIGGVIITAFLDPILTLILASLIPLVFISVFFISKKGVKLFTSVQESTDEMVGMLREHMDGIRVIKALSKSEYERKRFEKINESIYESDRRAATVTGLSSPIMSLLLNLGLVLAIVIGAIRVSNAQTEPGVIIAFLSYFTIILNAMMMVTRVFMNLSKGIASAKRLNEVFVSESESEIGGKDTLVTSSHVSFENVSFSYLGTRNNLSNLSFDIEKGQSLGILGSTGSGKTTAISLLLRLYPAGSGTIRINGEDILSIPREKLYSMFGFALQSDFLMSDTIKENLRFERELSDEQLENAARDALAHYFIMEKDGGYDHLLNIKAANLSGGQKQRMLIARALAGNPEILILDDSSGGLDYKTDALLRSNIAKKYQSCTKIFVAQRVATIKDCDRIIVLDRGKVVGDGKHAYLMENCPLYKETALCQMGQRLG